MMRMCQNDSGAMQDSFDVLIIGAGMAGLAAGRLLACAGRRVGLLEARDRIGGRIHTVHAGGVPIELGAEFVHGRPPALWALIREAGLATVELEGEDFSFENGRLGRAAAVPSRAHRVLADMMAWRAAQPGDVDLSFADYLRIHPPADPADADAATRYVEGFNAADRQRIGIASLARQQAAEDAIEADRLFRLEAGYQALPQFLASAFTRAGGRLMLGAPVQRIEWRRGAVRLQTRERRWRARQALITVPLAVLAQERIEFEPRPAGILQQAARLAMGSALRATLRFDAKLWPEELGFLFAPGETPPTWWTPLPLPAALITAWAGGPAAGALPGADSPALAGTCLTTLARILSRPRAELEAALLSWHGHDWSADPFAGGAYSYVPAGALDAPLAMTQPVDETLYFAGEHTDTTGHWGTVHAALQSGTVAAEHMLRAPPLG